MMLGGVASASEHGHAGLTSNSPVLWEIDIPFWEGHTLPINNSLVMFAIAVIFITILLRLASRRMQRIPSGLQNFVEWVFELLYNFVEGLTGKTCEKILLVLCNGIPFHSHQQLLGLAAGCRLHHL